MRHIKLFESYSIPNTDTVYVAVVGSTSGPDFNICFVNFQPMDL